MDTSGRHKQERELFGRALTRKTTEKPKTMKDDGSSDLEIEL